MNKDKYVKFHEALKQTDILRFPQHTLATFGATNVNYYFLSEISKDSTRIRQGKIHSRKPQIILPNHLPDVVEGFDGEIREFANALLHKYGENLRILGYQLHNECHEAETVQRPFEQTLKSVLDKVSPESLAGIIKGPDSAWEISVLKFIFKVTEKSFPANMTELEEHGFFDPDRPVRIIRKYIEKMFTQAEQNPEDLKNLADYLRKCGLFEEYQDRFFSLVYRSK